MPGLFLRTILVFILFSAVCFSQQPEFLQGKLIDSITEEPVVFATIRIKSRAIGVISNMDGTFSIPEKFKTYGDTLEISSMGYENHEISISNLSQEEVLVIYLRPSVIELAEAIVRARRKRKKRISARQIVSRALANIRRNYAVRPFSIVGYYRDYQLKNKKYINLNEGILEVFDKGFLKLDRPNSKVLIYDYKKNTDFERDTLADGMYNYTNMQKIVDNAYLFDYGGNEFTILRVHDAIRNYNLGSYSFVDRLDQDLLNNHNFTKAENTYLGDKVLYTVKFRKSFTDNSAFGTLYISQGDYAIHKMEYTVYDELKRNPNRVLNKHNTRGRLLFEVITEYQKNEGKMYLNYISFHNKFMVSKPAKFLVDEVLVDSERNRFEVMFNDEPEERTALKKGNYHFSYDGRKIKFDKIVLFEKHVYLYPKLNNFQDREDFKRIAEMAIANTVDRDLFRIDVDDIKDRQGNLLNARYYEGFDQFREFFAQRIKTNSVSPDSNVFMDNTKPIFKDQPIARPDNFSDYWMNTPLKTIEN